MLHASIICLVALVLVGGGIPQARCAEEPPRLEDRDAAGPGVPESTLTGPNVRLTQLSGLRESQTTIAVNPLNPQNLIAGAICTDAAAHSDPDCSYTSMDGGQSWVQQQFIPPFQSGGDPAVTFCGDGSAYYVQLGYQVLASSVRTGLFVYKSSDGGASWSASTTILEHTTQNDNVVTDKPWITCDPVPGSPFANRVYVVYRDVAGDDSSVIRVKRSADGGATWQGPVQVSSGTAAPQNGGYLAVGTSGELYVVWARAENVTDVSGMFRFDRSVDGGVTFGATDVNAGSYVTPSAFPDPHFPISSFSSMAVDRSNGPHRGTIYIAWPDARNGDLDVLLIRSADGGATWSAPLRVNDDALGNGALQWNPALAVDPKGRVVATYYDRRRFIGGTRYEIRGQISRDGAQTFDTSFLISDTPSNAPTSTFLGDYDSVVATSNHLHTLWADQRPGTSAAPDIYTDAFPNSFDYDEVRNVRWTDHDDLGFEMQDARFGQDLDYDVVSGLLSEMSADRGFPRASCLAALWPASPFVDPRQPPALDGYYYLIRAHGPAGVGTYGDGSPKRPNVRDPLDEALATCP